MSKATIPVLVVLIIAVAVAIEVIPIVTEPTYSIEYDLDGGQFVSDDVQTSYKTGDIVVLPQAVRDGYVLYGWLDTETGDTFDGDTSYLQRDLKLEAEWGKNMEGKQMRYSVSGRTSQGFNYSTYTGTVSYTYLYFDTSKGNYYIQNDTDIMVTQYIMTWGGGTTSYSYPSVTQEFYWTTTVSIDYDVDEHGERIIYTDKVTMGGKSIPCYRYTYTIGNSSVQVFEGVDDGIDYYTVRTGSTSTSVYEEYTTYIGTEDVEVKVSSVVTIYSDQGITVTGEGTYNRGNRVTVTATAAPGTEFYGWYDGNWNLVSLRDTYTFEVGGADIILYAANTVAPDKSYESRDDAVWTSDATTAVWSLAELDGTVIVEYTGSVFEFGEYNEVGDYLLMVDETTDGATKHSYCNIRVYGPAEKTFDFKYKNTTYTFSMSIEYKDLVYAREYYGLNERRQTGDSAHNASFVNLAFTDPIMRPYTMQLVEYFSGFSSLGDTELATTVLNFTQYIEYQTDDVYMGAEEYWKFPLETLYDKGGDCEDTSILCSAILSGLGYKSALLLFNGHMASSVVLEKAQGTYFPINGEKYCYCETTAIGYAIGSAPSGYDRTRDVVLIEPRETD